MSNTDKFQKNILLAFDSFKDTLSADLVCSSLERSFRNLGYVNIKTKPLSDGGEGFIAALTESLQLTAHQVTIIGPLGNDIQSTYSTFILDDIKTAVIEMALAAGLEMVPEDSRCPLNTTALGVGMLIKHAIEEK